VDTESTALAKNLASMIDQKKGEDIVIYDLRNLSPITDYFIISTGLSDVHVRTIAEYIMEQERPRHAEGLEAASWVLLDFFDVIVHVFSRDTREFYGLERLWGDAPIVEYRSD